MVNWKANSILECTHQSVSDVSLAAGGIISATAPTAAVSFFFIAANGCPALMCDQLFSELMSQYAIFCLWTLTLEVVKSARRNALEWLRDWSAGPFCYFNSNFFFFVLFNAPLFCSEKNCLLCCYKVLLIDVVTKCGSSDCKQFFLPF